MTFRNIFLLIMVLTSCGRTVQDPDSNRNSDELSLDESFVQVNKYLVKRQQDQISSFAERMQWEMKKTNTGLWYDIYEKGEGKPAVKEKIVTLNYTISLLDGTICDSSKDRGPKSFRIGHGGVESGLEEGILLLKEGDRARFIMPPHLAHGNFGNRENIPPGAILLYDVEVLNLR